MKNSILLFSSVFACLGSMAQPIVTGNHAPVNFNNAATWYEKNVKPNRLNEDEDRLDLKSSPAAVKEIKDYQFGRWAWYWNQHLDANGNMVAPIKNVEEYQKAIKTNGNALRTTANTVNWSFIGPDSSAANGEGVGRINTIAFHPTDVNTFWIGSPGGGAWKTTTNGAKWTCMTDMLPNLSVSDIKINPLNPNTIYLCSGDREAQDFYGIGVLKSTNGGTTWNNTGIHWTLPTQLDVANSLLINPLDTNRLILGTTYGILKSYDGGTTWRQVASGNFMQLLYKPNDTNFVYATSYYDYASSTAAQIYRSADGGNTWSQVTSFTNYDRVSIAVTPANTAIVKAIASSNSGTNAEGLGAIYSSSDSGLTFTSIFAGSCSTGHNLLAFSARGSGCGGQGFYDLPIAISPTNASLVYVGGVNAWRSTNGGTSWTVMSQWSGQVSGVITIHADKHLMAFHPLLPGRFFEANDGGIYSTDNPISSGVWNNLTNGLGIEQIYRVGVSNVANFQMVGAQDVGTKQVNAGVYTQAVGGDGMQCLVDFADATVAYGSSEYGYIDILNPVSAFSPSDISQNIAAGSVEGTGGWITPFVQLPTCNKCLLAGYKNVYYSSNRGASWISISPVLATSDILRVVPTVADSQTIYVVEDNSNLIHYTHDFGTTWTTLTSPYSGAKLSDLAVDPRNKNHIFVTYSGYGSPKVAQWSTTGTGAGTWSTFNTGLPDVPVNCVAFDRYSRDMYVGTDIGVYVRDSAATTWSSYFTGMPAVRVNDLQIKYKSNELYAATFGRSLWKTTKRTNTVGVATVENIENKISVSPNPSNGYFTVASSVLADKEVTLRLLDLSGKVIKSTTNSFNTSGTVNFDAKGVAPGTYIFEVATETGVEGREKVVVY